MTFQSSAEGLLKRMLDALAERPGSMVIRADSDERPDLILVDRQVGIHAIEIEMNGASLDDREPFVRLNRKRSELRDSLGELASSGIGAAVVLGSIDRRLLGTPEAGDRRVLGTHDLADPTWPDMLPEKPINEREFGALVERLAPAIVFDRKGRQGATDPGAADRELVRVQLDAAQVNLALGNVEDVLVISGPPGSGKTLLLAARARQLARIHPDWRIAVLMYNRALVPYVSTLIDEPAVVVTTVGKFAHALGFSIDFCGGESAWRDLEAARVRGIPRSFDALMIDESQDFDPAWLSLVLDTVRPGHGGAVLVGDSAQSLYREPDLGKALYSHRVVHKELGRPYRSTTQILRAASVLSPASSIAGIDQALPGEPIDLIWASSSDEQAACAAWEIEAMISSGQRDPSDIAILITQWRGALSRLRTALESQGVPYEVINRSNSAEFDPTSPVVKLLTVHSGKGHEFPVVLLFGLERLPAADNEESERRRRVGFVGVTRAKDQLLITYTRQNEYLDPLISLGEDIRRWVWPDDYEV